MSSITLARSIRQVQRCNSSLIRGKASIRSFVVGGSANVEESGNTSSTRPRNPLISGISRQHNLIRPINITVERRYKYFSTEVDIASAPSTESTETETATLTATDVNPVTGEERSPSVLTNIPSYPNITPGQALSALQINFARGKFIRHSDFQSLCSATRVRHPLDSKVVRTALLDLKRCNNFQANTINAKFAMEAMMRGFLSDYNNDGIDSNDIDGLMENTQPEHRIKAGIFTGEAFVDPNTGLYIAAENEVVNETVLKSLWTGVDQLDTSVVQDDSGEQESDEDSDDAATPNPIFEAAKVAKDVIDALMERASTPTQHMKKRRKRKYLRTVQTTGGPTPQSIDYAVKTCLKLDGENEEAGIAMAKEMLDDYAERPYIGVALDETTALLKEAEAAMLAKKEAEAAAAAADNETEGDEESTEEK
eukprot:CAMPEP_0194104732 /NCGR_PEP_ID=MMETSP0150-20130528/5049_1 /TAXON_ID=122233 /ORGANISM="Chaetoceros debilis, Strain MM31A-1" /LENGTH=423 /DNA_ID=CAMNT_0038792371 /DNA_START=36 /DNA_END=1307 /DNA_ORIENTATION=+